MKNPTLLSIRTFLVYLFCYIPYVAQADFLDKVSDNVFKDPASSQDKGLLQALLNATSWITAIFTFLGVIMLFSAWYEFKKKDVGSVVYTLGAVGGLFMTPVIVKTLKAISAG